MTDARTLNWGHVVPAAEGRTLLLAVGDEAVEGAVVPLRTSTAFDAALAEGPYSAVVAVDLSRWTAVTGRTALRLLGDLAAVVAPGGYLYAGFPGRLYPLHLTARGAAVHWRARRVVRRRGLDVVSLYVTLPGASCPAIIVPVDTPWELDYVLRHLSFPYATSSRPLVGRLRQQALRAMQSLASRAPHSLRVAGSPAHAVVAFHPRSVS